MPTLTEPGTLSGLEPDCGLPRPSSPSRVRGSLRLRYRKLLGATAATWVLAWGTAVQASLTIFACEPEWAALAKEIAPDSVIFSATHAHQDPHDIEARPALINALRRADLAVCTGASLEAGWLPTLQSRAGNGKVLPGAPGMLFATQGLPLIQDAHHHSLRNKGHLHMEGNPHVQLDPRLLIAVGQALADRLSLIDPPGAAGYRERYDRWSSQWRNRIEAWQHAAKPLFGQAVIAEHSTFAYLFNWLELYQSADLEPIPGVPPSLSHLQGLLRKARNDPPIAIMQTLYQDPQPGRWLSQRLSVPSLTLPSTVTPDGDTSRLEGLFDHLLRVLLDAQRQRREGP